MAKSNIFRVLTEWLKEAVGEKISPTKAMSLPAVWHGVTKICNHVATLPLVIHQKLPEGGSQKAVDHWAYEKLHLLPNTYQTHDVFRSQINGHAILWGNGRAAIVNRGLQAAELIPLMPDRTMTVLVEGKKYHVTQPEKDDRLPLFESFIANAHETIVLPDEDVIHVQGFSFNGFSGLSLVQAMQRALGLSSAQDDQAYFQTKKGFSAKLLLEAPPGTLREKKDAEEFMDRFNEVHSRPENAGKAGLLREGMKAQILNMSNHDAQFLESRRLSRQDVMLMLNLPGMPGDGDSHSYNSKEMEALEYLDSALNPWLCKWETQINAKVLSARDRKAGYFARFNLGALLRTDSNTQADIIVKYRQCGVYSSNEARELLDLNPRDGGDSYDNPAITPGGDPNPPPADTSTQNRLAMQETLRGFLQREANNAISGAKSKNFIDWIDANYAKWEAKMADKLEAIGLDRDLAQQHCEESREILLDVAGKSTQETLENNVKEAVANWKNRYSKLMEAQYV